MSLLIIPIIGIFGISSLDCFSASRSGVIYTGSGDRLTWKTNSLNSSEDSGNPYANANVTQINNEVSYYKKIAFITTILNLIISLIIYILFDFSNNQFQFVQEHYDISFYDIYLGVDGIIYIFCIINNYNNAYSIII